MGGGSRVGRGTGPVHSCEGPLGANGDRLWQATDKQALGWGGSEGVDGAAGYPVVADPTYHVGWTGLFVRWSRSEARWLTGLSLGMTAAAVSTMCVGPHAPPCGGAVFGIWYVTNSLNDWAIDQLYARGCRLETRLAPWTSTYIWC